MIVALAIAFVGWLVLGRSVVRRQEARPAESPAGTARIQG